MAALRYKDYKISVSTIYDSPNQFHVTPIVKISKNGYDTILVTITTQQSFDKEEDAISRGLELGQRWINELISHSPR